jgi:DHA2 family multidrug resistance protein-like MFS transporter
MAGGVPGGIPPEAGEAARGTLGGAVGVAERLPDQPAAMLLTIARESFTQGLVLTAAISAALMIATAIMVAIALHRVAEASEHGSSARGT